MIPTGANVQLIHRGDAKGRIVSRTDYLAGYAHYTVECPEDPEKPLKVGRITVHESEMVVVDTDNAVEDGEAPLALGTYVRVKPIPGECIGLVTGIAQSVSGCAELEISYYEPTKGVVRQLLEPVLVEEVPEPGREEVGASTGSIIREPASR